MPLPESPDLDVPAADGPVPDATAADAPIETAAPVRVIPDRADAPVSEVTERFLRAIVAVVPIERIDELHLFSPLRQGTVETGIAVLAASVPAPAPAPVEVLAPELALEPGEPDVAADEPAVLAADEIAPEPQADGADAPVATEAPLVAEAPVVADAPVAAEAPVAADAPITRHTVYTCRYRLVIKGPERGKWEANVVAEADAPLITVETVVRGVQRRAGEDTEIVRYTGTQIARALRLTPASVPVVTTPAVTTPDVTTPAAP